MPKQIKVNEYWRRPPYSNISDPKTVFVNSHIRNLSDTWWSVFVQGRTRNLFGKWWIDLIIYSFIILVSFCVFILCGIGIVGFHILRLIFLMLKYLFWATVSGISKIREWRQTKKQQDLGQAALYYNPPPHYLTHNSVVKPRGETYYAPYQPNHGTDSIREAHWRANNTPIAIPPDYYNSNNQNYPPPSYYQAPGDSYNPLSWNYPPPTQGHYYSNPTTIGISYSSNEPDKIARVVLLTFAFFLTVVAFVLGAGLAYSISSALKLTPYFALGGGLLSAYLFYGLARKVIWKITS